MKDYRIAKKRIDVSPGESVRILRELQDLSQSRLAELRGRWRHPRRWAGRGSCFDAGLGRCLSSLFEIRCSWD